MGGRAYLRAGAGKALVVESDDGGDDDDDDDDEDDDDSNKTAMTLSRMKVGRTP